MSNTVILGCVAVACGVLGFFAGLGFASSVTEAIDIDFDEEDYEGWIDKR